MGVEAVKMIATVLLTNKSLKHVDLGSQCGFRSPMLVFDVSVRCHIRSGTECKTEGAIAIAQSLQTNRTVMTINLSSEQCNSKAQILNVAHVGCCVFWCVDIGIDPEGTAAIVAALQRNSSMKSVDLSCELSETSTSIAVCCLSTTLSQTIDLVATREH